MDLWEQRETDYKNSLFFGLRDLDNATYGVPHHRIWTIGARPSEGKTTFALQLALKWAEQGKKIVFFSNEHSKEGLKNILAAKMFKLNSKDIAIGRITEDFKPEIEKYFTYLDNLPLKIYDQMEYLEEMSMFSILHDEKPEAFFYDYIQMIRSPNSYVKQHDYMASLMVNIMGYVKQNKVSAFLVSQCARRTDDRKHGLPTNADLSDASALEKNSDGVILLCWPWKWHYTKFLDDPGADIQRSDYWIVISKNRYGDCGKWKHRFLPEHGSIEDV